MFPRTILDIFDISHLNTPKTYYLFNVFYIILHIL